MKNLTREFYRGNIINFIFLLFASISEALILIAVSLMLEKVLSIAASKDLESLYSQGVMFIGLLLFIILLYVSNMYIKPKYKQRAMIQYKNNIFDKIMKKSISSFTNNDTSTYLSSLTNDVNYIETNYIYSIFTLITNILIFILSLVIMIIYHPLLTLIAIILSLLPFVVAILVGGRLAFHEKRISDENASFMHSLKDNFVGFSTIKVFKSEAKIKKLFNRKNDYLEETKAKRERVMILMEFLQSVSSLIAQIGVFLVGAYISITTDKLEPSVIILFVQLMNYVMNPLSTVPQLLSKRRACLPLFKKINDIINEEEVADKKNVSFEKAIEVCDLSYQIGDKKILNNVNYKFEKGLSYAIVGGSGSGKTTIVNMLLGRGKDYQGTIKYDEDELRDLSLDSLYNIVSFVEQNVFVFDDSIINNITMYSRVDEDILQKAISRSGLQKLIDEKGKDYKCGENGRNLSGGEKQRISIARALIKKSQIMLMDEATSALDNETSASVLHNILTLEDMTKIIITHRLEEKSLEMFDRILVVKNGRIVEEGTFCQLLSQNGYFKSLYDVSN